MRKHSFLIIFTLILILVVISIVSVFLLKNNQNMEEKGPGAGYQERLKEYASIMEKEPLWYQNEKLKPQLDRYFRKSEEEASADFIQEKRAFIQMVGTMLEQDKVKLGEPLENFDEERKDVDMVVIHHTETSEESDFNYIHGIHLFTLYVIPIFDNPQNSNYGKPVYSGHYDEKGRQVFYGYHYLVRPDGTVKKTLKDEALGYHARQVNSHSVGIALIGSFQQSIPSQKTLESVRQILKQYPSTQIVGHREVVETTDCPGNTFLGDSGWKKELID